MYGLHKQVVRTRYPNSYLIERDHPKQRFRVKSGVRENNKPELSLGKSWYPSADKAWQAAYEYISNRNYDQAVA